MNTGKKYKTKQKSCILDCIMKHTDSYVTIQQISDYLDEMGDKVGLTTIYRNLDRLVEEKQIAKVSIDGISGTCYKVLSEQDEKVLFYLKCETCGKLVHIDCPELEHLYHHLSEEHHIEINPGKTMFYGKCEKCLRLSIN